MRTFELGSIALAAAVGYLIWTGLDYGKQQLTAEQEAPHPHHYQCYPVELPDGQWVWSWGCQQS